MGTTQQAQTESNDKQHQLEQRLAEAEQARAATDEQLVATAQQLEERNNELADSTQAHAQVESRLLDAQKLVSDGEAAREQLQQQLDGTELARDAGLDRQREL